MDKEIRAIFIFCLYVTLHCSAFRKGDSTVVISAPPNTGKTISTMTACMEHGGEFLAEDIAITDGEMVYSVPWTSTYRYYSHVEKGFGTRTFNAFTRIFPPLELLTLSKPKRISAYVDKEKICDSSKITYLVILERGSTSVQQASPGESYRKISNLNRYEFNYHKAPLIVAYEFFNPSLNIAAYKAEQDILKKLVDNAHKRLIIRTNKATNYTSLILGAMT